MANFEDLILRDTRGNQPAAGQEGRLYYVTDESVLERDSGSIWEDYSAAGGSVSGYVPESLFDAQTVLAATVDDTPAALVVGEATIVGRQTSGDISAIGQAASGEIVAGTETALRGISPADMKLSAETHGGGSGGSGGLWTMLEAQTPTSTGTVTFSDISGDYSKLVIDYTAKSTASADSDTLFVVVNADSTDSNYWSIRYIAFSTASFTQVGEATRRIGNVPAATAPANSAGTGKVEIAFYADTTFNKNITSKTILRDGATGQNFNVGLEWENTDAITSISLTLGSGDFDSGSSFKLYAVADAPF